MPLSGTFISFIPTVETHLFHLRVIIPVNLHKYADKFQQLEFICYQYANALQAYPNKGYFKMNSSNRRL